MDFGEGCSRGPELASVDCYHMLKPTLSAPMVRMSIQMNDNDLDHIFLRFECLQSMTMLVLLLPHFAPVRLSTSRQSAPELLTALRNDQAKCFQAAQHIEREGKDAEQAA